MGLHLILPESAKPAYRCTMPGCEATFTKDERSAFVRHCVNCANRHDEAVQKVIEHRESNVFTSIADKEQYQYLRRRNS